MDESKLDNIRITYLDKLHKIPFELIHIIMVYIKELDFVLKRYHLSDFVKDCYIDSKNQYSICSPVFLYIDKIGIDNLPILRKECGLYIYHADFAALEYYYKCSVETISNVYITMDMFLQLICYIGKRIKRKNIQDMYETLFEYGCNNNTDIRYYYSKRNVNVYTFWDMIEELSTNQ